MGTQHGSRIQLIESYPGNWPFLADFEIGLGEIFTDAQQRLARELCDGITHAITKVERRRVQSLAIAPKGLGCLAPMVFAEGYYGDPELL